MERRVKIVFLLFLVSAGLAFWISISPDLVRNEPKKTKILKILKDVGEQYLDHFGLSENDFRAIKDASFDVIAGNFDICASEEDVRFYLDNAEKFGLKVILGAGAGEAEWGYPCDDNFDPKQKPIWQKEKVVDWVEKWKSHPAIFAWDISNEAGENFPNSAKLTLSDLETAYRDVRVFDPDHQVMIRMNGWYFYDYDENFFRAGNPFGKNVADIVMVNAYSNVEDYYDDFVPTVASRASKEILALDSDIKIIVALGAWEEPPLWVMPTAQHLRHDYEKALNTKNLLGVAFFKYGASGVNPELWSLISGLNPNK